jgi:exopolysaccharide production protein ExoQ
MTRNNASVLAPFSRADRSTMTLVVAFTAWFVAGMETATNYLFFQADPRVGTIVNLGASCAMLYLTILVAVAFGYSKEKHVWSGPAQWILVYAVLTGVSLCWTQSSSLVNASGYWVAFIASLATIAVLIRSDRADNVALAALQGYVWASVILALIGWTAAGTYELRMGQQEYLHPNAIGNQVALAALFSIFLARRYPAALRWNWITTGLVFSLLRTLSKASIISFLVAAGFYFVRYSKLSARSQLKIAVVGAVLILASWGFIARYADVYTEGTNVETLTGRTVIWAVSWEIAAERPWLGHGFYSYRSVVPNFGEFKAWHAHNDFLQQFFSYGVAGLMLSLAVYGSFYRQLRRAPRSPRLGLASAVLIYGLLHGLTDASHIELMLPGGMILLFAEWVGESPNAMIGAR